MVRSSHGDIMTLTDQRTSDDIDHHFSRGLDEYHIGFYVAPLVAVIMRQLTIDEIVKALGDLGR